MYNMFLFSACPLQGALLQELMTDCWDHDPDARLTAQCVVGRLHALQTIRSV